MLIVKYYMIDGVNSVSVWTVRIWVYKYVYVTVKLKIEYENDNKNISKYAEHVSMYKVGGGAGADGVSRES